VGFVFQLHHLIGVLSAAGNAELPLIAARMRAAERRRRAREALERVGLGDRADDRPEQLSGGERQRVAIARAIAHGPRLVLADEPTGSLDDAAAARILELLASLCADDGATVIVVSHDPVVAHYADRRLVLEDGVLHEPARPGRVP
jgi:putative ABC transport system ATP-binding protein